LSAASVSEPAPVFVRPTEPARTADTVPAWPSNATVLFVSVPDWTVPPANDTVPVRVKS